MEQDKKIRFAVVGCGHIGKRHIEMVRREPGAQLVAICDVLPLELLKLDTGDQSVGHVGLLRAGRQRQGSVGHGEGHTQRGHSEEGMLR